MNGDLKLEAGSRNKWVEETGVRREYQKRKEEENERLSVYISIPPANLIKKRGFFPRNSPRKESATHAERRTERRTERRGTKDSGMEVQEKVGGMQAILDS